MTLSNDHIDWLNFDIVRFEYNVEEKFQSNGFNFEDSFENTDAGQHQKIPHLIDETDLLRLLRTEKSKRESVNSISPEICEYYDKCVEYFHNDHIKLLSEYLANVGCIEKLDQLNKEGKLLKFFDRRNTTAVNFGHHECLQESAEECNTSMNSKLEKLGLELQRDTQTFREKALVKIEDQLKTCITRYEAFGKEKWIEACKKTSLVNILDQHFAVQLKAMPVQEKEIDNGDSEDSKLMIEFEDLSSPNDMVQPSTEKLSIFLFSLAIYDSKKMIDKDIRNRRAQITERRTKEAAMKAKRDRVDIAASSIKPSDAVRMLGDRFGEQDMQLANQSKRLDALEDAQVKLGTSIAKTAATDVLTLIDVEKTSEVGNKADDKIAILIKQQEQMIRDMALLKVKVTASTPTQPNVNTAAFTSKVTKNDSRADDDHLSNRARKKAKKEAAHSTAAQTMIPANPQPSPPSFTGRNSNGKTGTQQHHQKSTAGGQGSSQGSATRQDDHPPTGNAMRKQRNLSRRKGGDQAQA
jgi:hypothetical protein